MEFIYTKGGQPMILQKLDIIWRNKMLQQLKISKHAKTAKSVNRTIFYRMRIIVRNTTQMIFDIGSWLSNSDFCPFEGSNIFSIHTISNNFLKNLTNFDSSKRKLHDQTDSTLESLTFQRRKETLLGSKSEWPKDQVLPLTIVSN